MKYDLTLPKNNEYKLQNLEKPFQKITNHLFINPNFFDIIQIFAQNPKILCNINWIWVLFSWVPSCLCQDCCIKYIFCVSVRANLSFQGNWKQVYKLLSVKISYFLIADICPSTFLQLASGSKNSVLRNWK